MSHRLMTVGIDSVTYQYGTANADDTAYVPALASFSGTPTLTAGAALGTGATTPTIVGNNVAGKITFTSAALALIAGQVLTATFATALSHPNGTSVVLTPGNNAYAAAANAFYATSTQSAFTLNAGLALGLSTTYVVNYQLIGY